MTYPTLWRTDAPTLWGDLFNGRRGLDRTADRFFGSLGSESASTTWTPAVDVRETTDAIEIVAELPGLRPDDVNVSVEDGTLSISGEKHHTTSEGSDGESYHRVERRWGRFERSFRLPRTVGADKVHANFHDGLLTVTLPKAEEAKARKIAIDVATK